MKKLIAICLFACICSCVHTQKPATILVNATADIYDALVFYHGKQVESWTLKIQHEDVFRLYMCNDDDCNTSTKIGESDDGKQFVNALMLEHKNGESTDIIDFTFIMYVKTTDSGLPVIYGTMGAKTTHQDGPPTILVVEIYGVKR